MTLAAARETLGTRALGLRTWQLSPIWVVGLEADLQGALEKESSTVTNNFQFTIGNPPSGGVTGTAVAQYTAKIDWFGTVRLREVVGTGTEGKLLIPGWTYKIETLYMDLGHLDATGVTSGVSFNGPPEAVASPL